MDGKRQLDIRKE